PINKYLVAGINWLIEFGILHGLVTINWFFLAPICPGDLDLGALGVFGETSRGLDRLQNGHLPAVNVSARTLDLTADKKPAFLDRDGYRQCPRIVVRHIKTLEFFLQFADGFAGRHHRAS